MKDYYKHLEGIESLTQEEEYELVDNWQIKGCVNSRNRLLESQMKWIIKVCRKFNHFDNLDELVSEAILLACDSLNRFDTGKGYRLTSFIAICLNSKMNIAVSNLSRNIRLPVHAIDTLAKIRILNNKREDNNTYTVDELKELINSNDERIILALNNDAATRSINHVVAEGLTVEDIIECEKATLDIDFQLMKSDLKKAMYNKLEKKEIFVLNHRFGLDGHSELTLRETGEMFGVTRQRIDQIQKQAFDKIREDLKGWM